MKIRFAVILIATALFTGCSGIPTAITASTSPIPPGVRGSVPAFGSDCQYFLLGIIPISTPLNSQAALDQAKEQADVDVLTDVTVDFGGGYYVLFSNNCVRIHGKGVPRDVLAKALNHEVVGKR
jgi:hypothetical protein